MRRTMILIVGLLAASAALAPSASAHDYHRSKRAVESSHARDHHARKHRHVQRYCRDYRGRPRGCVVKRSVPLRHAAPRYRPSFVIVISPNGYYRVARRYF